MIRSRLQAIIGLVLIIAMFGIAAWAATPDGAHTHPELEVEISTLQGFHETTTIPPETTTTTTTMPPTTTTEAPPPDTTTTTEAPPETTTTTTTGPPPEPGTGQILTFTSDTVITGETITLRPTDEIRLENGAMLMFGPGASLDAQGTPVATWSDDGNTQNLVRDVKITGEGNIMFTAGGLPSTINYVEVDLQPDFEFDEYPLHWHKMGDDSRGTEVIGTVVKNSTNRAFVPHASHGITFRDTICKDAVLSCYWWNGPPGTDPGNDIHDISDQSHDILYDHVLADGEVCLRLLDSAKIVSAGVVQFVGFDQQQPTRLRQERREVFVVADRSAARAILGEPDEGYVDRIECLQAPLSGNVEVAQRFDFVTEELDTDRRVPVGGKDIDDPASDREFARQLHGRHTVIAVLRERCEQLGQFDPLANRQTPGPFGHHIRRRDGLQQTLNTSNHNGGWVGPGKVFQ